MPPVDEVEDVVELELDEPETELEEEPEDEPEALSLEPVAEADEAVLTTVAVATAVDRTPAPESSELDDAAAVSTDAAEVMTAEEAPEPELPEPELPDEADPVPVGMGQEQVAVANVCDAGPSFSTESPGFGYARLSLSGVWHEPDP